jgi:multiple sugar transport system permease protein
MSFRGTKINPDRFHHSQIKFYFILVPIALVMLLPIVFIFAHALKPVNELFEWPPKFYVKHPTFDNFSNLFKETSASGIPFSRYLFNSILVTAIGVVATIFITTLSGYALSKLNFKFKKQIFNINQMALMFVPVAVVIPRYLTIASIGITNTFFAHIIPLLAFPVGLFLVKQFIDQVPKELFEAARLDGASDFQIYLRIVLPVIRSAIATVGILAFQTFWNNVETSNLFVNDESQRTLAFFLSTLATNSSVAGQGMAAAASLLMFIPNLVFFIIVQGKVMDTMAHSGIK